MAGIETPADLMGFFSPAEFGEEARLRPDADSLPVIGIPDTAAALERPAGNNNSGSSPFLVGAADIAVQELQFLTNYQQVASAQREDTLQITTGTYAGRYRIKDIQRDNEIVRLVLNIR